MAPLIYTNENDLTLFHKIKEDSQGAFKTLFLRYYDKLSGFVVLLHHDASLAEEAVQEVFASIWEKRHEIEITTSVKYYLYNACRNHLFNLVTEKDHQHQALSEAMENMIADDQNPEKIFSFEALNHDFHEAIDTLPQEEVERNSAITEYNPGY